MFLGELRYPVQDLKGIGKTSAETLAEGGIHTVADFLSNPPRKWRDYTVHVPLNRGYDGTPVNTVVEVIAHDYFGRAYKKVLKVYVRDETAMAALLCFNRNFLANVLTVGKKFYLYGQFSYNYGELQSGSFETEPYGSEKPKYGTVEPIYPLAGNLSQKQLRKAKADALRRYGSYIDDEIPAPLHRRYGLLPKAQALKKLHFPSSLDEARTARETLAFGELFIFQMTAARKKRRRREEPPAREKKSTEEAAGKEEKRREETPGRKKSTTQEPIDGAPTQSSKIGEGAQLASSGGEEAQPASSGDEGAQLASSGGEGASRVTNTAASSSLSNGLLGRAEDTLPFELTDDQEKALEEIFADLASLKPMARLLQGDVGSGKTLVALLSALPLLEAGYQVAFLAPTELLARQHGENAAALLEPIGIKVALLHGGLKKQAKAPLLSALAEGEADLIVGTHALFTEEVRFKSLRFVIIDEQHKFGVRQRSEMMAKGDSPDLLLMTATPIPRTLTLTLFGDLDVSTIKTMPPGRKPVVTHLARKSNSEKVYAAVRTELERGHKAYFVYPRIGDGKSDEKSDEEIKDAESTGRYLAEEVFPDFKVVTIHGRIEEEEKSSRMRSFTEGDTQVLVATSVVEVGVDVPEATIMVVEHAEMFGLAGLHQLRGRVGRGEHQSYAFLIYSDELSEEGKQRLKVMKNSSDGFVIAEEDLKLRGPGEPTGTRQSGELRFNFADLKEDITLLENARKEAFALVEEDPGLLEPENAALRELMSRAPPFSEEIFSGG